MNSRYNYKELSKEKKEELEKKSKEKKSEKEVTKPKKDRGASFSKKLDAFTQVTGIDPIQNLLKGPSQPDMDTPDLASEVRSRVEQKKARIASAPKMYPMYYERANKGKFFSKSVKAKCKLGRNKKTKIY
tara:strand:+ start:2011 stop:2400 length:390 start_codon:yes stop_codon:yes gene_type:complete